MSGPPITSTRAYSRSVALIFKRAAAASKAAWPTSHSSKSGSAGSQRLLGIGTGRVEHRPLTGGRQHRPLGEGMRLLPAEEDQRRLAVFHPGVVGLDEHGVARVVQRGGMLASGAGIGKALCANRSRPDGGLHHHLPLRHAHPLSRCEEVARHGRHTCIDEVGEVALVGVPRDHGRRVQQIGDAGTPVEEFVQPVDVVPGRPEDDEVGVAVFPGRPRTASGHGGHAVAGRRRARRRHRRPPVARRSRRARSWDDGGRGEQVS